MERSPGDYKMVEKYLGKHPGAPEKVRNGLVSVPLALEL